MRPHLLNLGEVVATSQTSSHTLALLTSMISCPSASIVITPASGAGQPISRTASQHLAVSHGIPSFIAGGDDLLLLSR